MPSHVRLTRGLRAVAVLPQVPWWDAGGGGKEARRVKPWLSELDVPEWQQELAGDRLGWRKRLKSTKIRTQLVLQVQDRRWIERKMPR
jgi:hypothetical protein